MPDVKERVEAILFAAGDSVPLSRLAIGAECSEEEAEAAVLELAGELDYARRGICVVKLGSNYQMCSRAEYGENIRRALEVRKPPKLSQTALEVIAVIAYKQPVTKAYIEQIRGVDSSYTVNTLVEKGLAEECGRLDVPGRPVLFRTTERFLLTFGLESLKELPPIDDTDREAVN